MGHNIVLVEQFDDPSARLWYARMTTEQGWSRSVLTMQIEAGAHRRHGKALTNFAATLPAPQSDLARDLLKDPYHFDFLTLSDDAQEKHLQAGLLEHLREFLIELGVGFAFVGSRYHLEVGGNDYYLGLLFYHLRLRAFLVIELKVTEFEPECLGKMNFYLSAVDEQLRHPEDRPSIGLILCPVKNSVVAEYACATRQSRSGWPGIPLARRCPLSFATSSRASSGWRRNSASDSRELRRRTAEGRSRRQRNESGHTSIKTLCLNRGVSALLDAGRVASEYPRLYDEGERKVRGNASVARGRPPSRSGGKAVPC